MVGRAKKATLAADANVDPQLAQRLLRLFLELNKRGTTIVIATRAIGLMDRYEVCRLVLHDGYMHVYE